MKENFLQKALFVGILLASFLSSNISFAAVSLGLSGSWAKNHLGLQSQQTQSGKASLTVDLGPYFRLGYSFRQTMQKREGYTDKADEDAEEEILVYFEQDVRMMTHSVDVFAVLYAGRIFTPFIFVGAALKYYKVTMEEDGEATTTTEYGPIPVPNYGAGLAVAINKSFSAKITNTWSVGQTTDVNGKTTNERDSQFDVGISYKLE